MENKERGFTLMELMIAVAIVGILAAIAYPSYMQYLVRSNRSVAKADLMELQQWMERNYSLTNRYDRDPNGAPIVLPFSISPRYQASNPQYQIGFSLGPTATAYTLQSVPQSNQNDIDCGTLTLSSSGVRGATGTSATCWSN